MDMILDLMAAHLAGETRHAEAVMQDLGISYRRAEPQPIADQWQFFGCENVPTTGLPPYLRERSRP